MELLYKGQVGDGSFVPYTVKPLYKGQVEGRLGPLSPIQWSLSTRDKLGMGPLSPIHVVEPLYKGQVEGRLGPLSLYSGASLQGTS